MASTIDPESAKALIKEYQDQNAAAGDNAIKTHEGHPLNGYFIDRDSMEKILSNPKAAGMSLHLAKHSQSQGSKQNHYTVIYGAAEPSTSPDAKTPYTNTGELYGDPPPCPP